MSYLRYEEEPQTIDVMLRTLARSIVSLDEMVRSMPDSPRRDAAREDLRLCLAAKARLETVKERGVRP